MREAIFKLREAAESMATSGTKLHSAFKAMKTGYAKMPATEQFVRLTPGDTARNELVGQILLGSVENFGLISDFPKKPWLQLDEKVRRDQIAMESDCSGLLNEPFKVQISTERSKIKSKLSHPLFPNSLPVFFTIQPEWHTQSEIVDQIRHQLKILAAQHPKLFRAEISRRGRTPKDLLRQLAALRLLDGRSYGQAMRLIDKARVSSSPYKKTEVGYGKFWYTAKENAKRFLKIVDSDGERTIRWIDEIRSRLG
jgi:hypothetical protein